MSYPSVGNGPLNGTLLQLLHELVHAPSGVDDPVLARKERVALGTDVDPHSRLGGRGLEHVPAGTGYRRLDVLGMNGVLRGKSYLVSQLLGLGRNQDADFLLIFGIVAELHDTVAQSEQGVILAQAHQLARSHQGAPLPHQDGAGPYGLAIPYLESESLSGAIAAVS